MPESEDVSPFVAAAHRKVFRERLALFFMVLSVVLAGCAWYMPPSLGRGFVTGLALMCWIRFILFMVKG